MATFLIAIGSLLFYLVAYHTYGRWMSRKLFKLCPEATVPSRELADGHDYVPTKKGIVFGHHFTSIAGTGPIVGPALAVIWGWLPALIWVLLGSVFIGAVHDLGALVVSLRSRGQTIGEVAGRIINPRVKVLFLLVLFLALTIVLAIFGLVIASIFDLYPASLLSVWIEVPIALALGWLVYRNNGHLPHWAAVAALAFMMGAIVLAIYVPSLQFRFAPLSLAGFTVSPVVIWTAILFVYCYFASTLPVWRLLQPRDCINSHQLILCLALVVLGIGAATFFREGGAPIVAPAVRTQVAGAPPMLPFLFITIACGAISGFHCLVASGTTGKQIAREPDAQFVGFGAMLTEGFLAVLVILACCAGLGMQSALTLKTSSLGWGLLALPAPLAGEYDAFMKHPGEDLILVRHSGYHEHETEFYFADNFHGGYPQAITPINDQFRVLRPSDEIALTRGWLRYESATNLSLGGPLAWECHYDSWSASSGLAAGVGAFVDGAGNFVASLGIPRPVAVAIMAVLVASFAATTLDTATRLQRYVVQELATTCRIRPLTGKHGATAFAIGLAAIVAAVPPPGMDWATGMGKGGLTLWPLFGATNQLLAGLAFMVIAFYLARRRMPVWFIVAPGILMLGVPLWAMAYQIGLLGTDGWWQKGEWHLVAFAGVVIALQIWMVADGLKLWPRIKGVIENELPPLRRGFPVMVEATDASRALSQEQPSS